MRPSKPKRTRLSPEDRYQQLVDIAVEMLLTEQLDELTVERVAEIAGVSKALIFHYFPTVRALRLAALEVAARRLVDDITQAVAAAVESGTELRSGVEAFVTFIHERPTTFDALSVMAATDEEFGHLFQAVRDQAAALVSVGLRIEPTELGWLLIGGWVALVEQTVRAWVTKPGGVSYDTLVSSTPDAEALTVP